jgi:hypothetical protein
MVMKKFALIGFLLLLPGLARADDASMLGPQTSSDSAASTQSSSVLQPASPSSLQSPGTSGVSQSSDQTNPQTAAGSQQAKLLIEPDTDQHLLDSSTDNSSPPWLELAGVALGSAIIIVAVIRLVRLRRLPKLQP